MYKNADDMSITNAEGLYFVVSDIKKVIFKLVSPIETRTVVNLIV